jgi:hypothetical protein
MLVVIASAVTGCGDDSPSKSSTDTTTTSPASTPSKAHQSRSSRYPGVYVEAARVCAIGPPEKVAENLGISTTKPRALARALAQGYLPKFRKTAFQGCLSALK